MIRSSRRAFLGGAIAFTASGCRSARARTTFRIGYLNNLTHAQPLVGARGAWAKALGAKVEMVAFPGGPAVMEAMQAGSLDAGFLGPTAIVNAFVRSPTKWLRVLSGSASGGASLVARRGLGVRSANDLRGRVVTAQLIGSTPDVSMRSYLRAANVRPKDRGGDVTIVPMANSEAFHLLKQGHIDAVWAQEPWASRMVAEAKAERVVDERELWPEGKFPTALLVASKRAIEARGDVLSALVRTLRDDTDRMRRDPDGALDEVSAALANAMGKSLPKTILKDAWSRLELTTDPLEDALEHTAESMRAIGYLPEGSLAGLVHKAPIAMRER